MMIETTLFQLVVLANLVVIAISMLVRVESAPSLDLNDPKTVQRLREMFQNSHQQSISDYYEQEALKMMTNIAADSERKDKSKIIPIALLNPEAKINGSNINEQLMKNLFVRYDVNESKASEDQEVTLQPKSTHHNNDHIKSDPRQSSLFNSYGFAPNNGFGNAFNSPNPLGGFLVARPTLPTLPQFPAFNPLVPRSTRPPKTSIIGNNGGPMALTNDNVVVVNVLSGNY